MSNQVRLFVAIELPKKVKQEIARIQEALKAAHCFEGKYVNPEQAHITIKFIGSVQTDQIALITQALAGISFVPCVARLVNIGLFCTGDFLKIVYINVVAPTLSVLAADLDDCLHSWSQSENYAEGHDFISHITLARVKHVEDRQRVHEVINAFKVEPIAFEITSFVLKQSVLTPVGPEHITLKTFSF